MQDLVYLASDDLEGRGTGTVGNRKARDYIINKFTDLDVTSIGASYEQPFAFHSTGPVTKGVNIVGKIDGVSEEVIVVSAHYDHLGKRKNKIYNGADDNASGVAGLLALATYFSINKPYYTLIFCAFDAEEIGLKGAKYFVSNLPVKENQVLLNINMDMIARDDNKRIYIAGTYHYPKLVPLLEKVIEKSPAKALLGNDQPSDGYNDWTFSSDHAPFHKIGIPFLYFGVEDHPDYHRHTDTSDKINADFFAGNVMLVLEVLHAVNEYENAQYR
ncbi:MAG: M28 family peptidase [Bacteroidota bacterium]